MYVKTQISLRKEHKMLLDFQFSNFRSFFDEQNLSFEATPLRGRTDCVFQTNDTNVKSVLPLCLLMGSNASGKSNLLKALDYVRTQVLTSYSKTSNARLEPNTSREAFSLNKAGRNNPSKFEITFVKKNIPYKYGFSCDDKKIINEWLFAYPLGQQQKWFTRKGSEYIFGKKFLGEKKALSDITPEDSLFLSVGIRSKNEQLKEIGNFFQSIRFDYKSQVSEGEISFRLKDESIDSRTIEFLRLLDTGIYGYNIKPKKITDSDEIFSEEIGKFLRAVKERTNKNIASNSEDDQNSINFLEFLKTQMQIYFMHTGADEDSIGIPFGQESDGTKRLLRLVQDGFEALDNGYLLVVDEIDASLHTRACELFVGLFLTPELNMKGAQLLASSHNTNLLSYSELRRDEAWFVEKQPNGQSQIYSAAEFKMRAEKNLESAYLDDRFGALPSKIDPKLLIGANG